MAKSWKKSWKNMAKIMRNHLFWYCKSSTIIYNLYLRDHSYRSAGWRMMEDANWSSSHHPSPSTGCSINEASKYTEGLTLPMRFFVAGVVRWHPHYWKIFKWWKIRPFVFSRFWSPLQKVTYIYIYIYPYISIHGYIGYVYIYIYMFIYLFIYSFIYIFKHII